MPSRMDGERKCGIRVHRNISQPRRKVKILSFAAIGTELVKRASHRKTSVTCSLSCAEARRCGGESRVGAAGAREDEQGRLSLMSMDVHVC